MARVVVAMSGGVDSSVAAALLVGQDHEVIGLFMRHGQETACATDRPGHQGCCSASDAADARRVADRLGIGFYALNFATEFDRVVDYFVAEYSAGRTPNPCIACNNWLKFGKLFDYADQVGADLVASGHYARVEVDAAGGPALLRGVDPGKDQSYVLFGVDRARLARLRFPVGGYAKAEIRRLAEQFGFAVADKPDSQEICFVPDGNHAEFVRRRRGHQNEGGEIVTTDGEVVGRHDGCEAFTIGQRKGLKVAFGEPRYVVRIEADRQRVVIGRKEELARDELIASAANWLIDPPDVPFDAEVMIRYRSRPRPARIEPLGVDRFRVRFAEPVDGVAPGQAAVCYDGPRVLGGGWIE